VEIHSLPSFQLLTGLPLDKPNWSPRVQRSIHMCTMGQRKERKDKNGSIQKKYTLTALQFSSLLHHPHYIFLIILWTVLILLKMNLYFFFFLLFTNSTESITEVGNFLIVFDSETSKRKHGIKQVLCKYLLKEWANETPLGILKLDLDSFLCSKRITILAIIPVHYNFDLHLLS
jgi:hypothetical protein